MKIPQKKTVNQRNFHSLQEHLACWHTKMCTMIRHIICKILVQIQQFRHECSSIMYENTQKSNKIKGLFITCFTSKCAYWFVDFTNCLWTQYQRFDLLTRAKWDWKLWSVPLFNCIVLVCSIVSSPNFYRLSVSLIKNLDIFFG